jgi:hypothetical protein
MQTTPRWAKSEPPEPTHSKKMIPIAQISIATSLKSTAVRNRG